MQIWFLGVGDEFNVEIMGIHNSKNGSKMKKMLTLLEQSDNLVVWDCRKPSLFVLPPHTFHAVMTLEMACHSGWRASSFAWEKEVLVILRKMMENLNPKVNVLDAFNSDVKTWIAYIQNTNVDLSHNSFLKEMADLVERWTQMMYP